jgi:acetyltransferase
VKLDSPDILHKTEAGGLKLNIKTAAELKDAYRQVMGNARRYNPKARINGVLIQEMVSGGTEVIIGVNNDPQFGPTVMFGLGGIFVEILKDVSLRVAPLSLEDALEMIREIKGFKILSGARGRAKADIPAIADTLVRVSRMALDLESRLSELDINPLLVLPEGLGVRVADALVIRRSAT